MYIPYIGVLAVGIRIVSACDRAVVARMIQRARLQRVAGSGGGGGKHLAHAAREVDIQVRVRHIFSRRVHVHQLDVIDQAAVIHVHERVAVGPDAARVDHSLDRLGALLRHVEVDGLP